MNLRPPTGRTTMPKLETDRQELFPIRPSINSARTNRPSTTQRRQRRSLPSSSVKFDPDLTVRACLIANQHNIVPVRLPKRKKRTGASSLPHSHTSGIKQNNLTNQSPISSRLSSNKDEKGNQKKTRFLLNHFFSLESCEDTKFQELIDDWLLNGTEEKIWNSVSEHVETSYLMGRVTSNAKMPNGLTSTICLDMLDQLSEKIPEYGRVLNVISTVLRKSVYPEPEKNEETGFPESYFEVCDKLAAENLRLKQKAVLFDRLQNQDPVTALKSILNTKETKEEKQEICRNILTSMNEAGLVDSRFVMSVLESLEDSEQSRFYDSFLKGRQLETLKAIERINPTLLLEVLSGNAQLLGLVMKRCCDLTNPQTLAFWRENCDLLGDILTTDNQLLSGVLSAAPEMLVHALQTHAGVCADILIEKPHALTRLTTRVYSHCPLEFGSLVTTHPQLFRDAFETDIKLMGMILKGSKRLKLAALRNFDDILGPALVENPQMLSSFLAKQSSSVMEQLVTQAPEIIEPVMVAWPAKTMDQLQKHPKLVAAAVSEHPELAIPALTQNPQGLARLLPGCLLSLVDCLSYMGLDPFLSVPDSLSKLGLRPISQLNGFSEAVQTDSEPLSIHQPLGSSRRTLADLVIHKRLTVAPMKISQVTRTLARAYQLRLQTDSIFRTSSSSNNSGGGGFGTPSRASMRSPGGAPPSTPTMSAVTSASVSVGTSSDGVGGKIRSTLAECVFDMVLAETGVQSACSKRLSALMLAVQRLHKSTLRVKWFAVMTGLLDEKNYHPQGADFFLYVLGRLISPESISRCMSPPEPHFMPLSDVIPIMRSVFPSASQTQELVDLLNDLQSPMISSGQTDSGRLVEVDGVLDCCMSVWFEGQSIESEVLRNIFRSFDDNGDGIITYDDFVCLTQKVDPQATTGQLMRMYKMCGIHNEKGEQVMTADDFVDVIRSHRFHSGILPLFDPDSIPH